MAKPLLNVYEAIAALRAVGASDELQAAFEQRVETVLAQRVSLTDADDRFEVSSGFGHHTKRGHVTFRAGTVEHQMTPAKAQEIARMLSECAEAAISDELVMKLLMNKLKLTDPALLGHILLDLRELRQGSRETVWSDGH